MQTEIPTTVPRYFFAAVSPHKGLFILAIFVVVLSSGLSQGSSYIFKIITDAIEADNLSLVLWVGLLYPVIIFVIQTLYRVSGLAVAVVQSKMIREQNNRLVAHLLNHSKNFFDNRFAGSLVSKVSHVVSGAEQFVATVVWTVVEILISLLVTAFLIFSVSWQAGLIFLSLVILIFGINTLMVRGKRKIEKSY